MKRLFSLFLVILMLALCGCNAILPTNGTLKINPNEIDHIKITNGVTNNDFSVVDRADIGAIVKHLNSYTLENGTNSESGDISYRYRVTLLDKTNGYAESHYYISDSQTIWINGVAYTADTADFITAIEKLEVKTLTDRELIDNLLQGDTLDRLGILDEDKKISVDMILALPERCPALFELLSRPEAIQTVGTYGVETIQEYLNSNNPALVEKAEEWIAVIEKLMPEMKEKLENLIKNQYFPENNP